MKKLLTLALVLMASSAFGVIVYDYGFEDGGLPIGYYGDGEPPILANLVTTPVHSGGWALRCEDNAASGTPQAFLVWIKNLTDGDVVTAGFWRFDDTPGTNPSCRIWGHWNDDAVDVNVYDGSASGNGDYGLGEGWDYTDFVYNVVDGHTGLIIEIRTYSVDGDVVWIDDLHIEAPDHAEVILPHCGTATEEGTWSEIKTLY
jgi:hypothetical protein